MEIQNWMIPSFAAAKLQENLQFADEYHADAVRNRKRQAQLRRERERRLTVRPIRHEERYLSSAYDPRGVQTKRPRAKIAAKNVDFIA